MELKGGTPPPPRTSWQWTDEQGKVVSVSKALFNVGAGKYHVKAIDPFGCEAEADFAILNESPELKPPLLTGDSKLCLPGTALINVTNVDTAGTYSLYSSDNFQDTIPLAQNKFGTFYRNVKEPTDFYVTYKQGNCESERIKFNVFVVAANVVIPNLFTPNNDGINDKWAITGLTKFPDATVDIYDRYGAQVFHALNYSGQFDGTFKGKNLEQGVYYYRYQTA